MVYKLSFRIRKIYLDQIVVGSKKREVRAQKPFWNVRVLRAVHQIMVGDPVIAVFVCGKEKHCRYVERIEAFDTAAEALGRSPSEQGVKDIGEGKVFGFDLGEVVP